ncbi:MAG: DUF2914 domain-containing protein [Calditrichaeota bacterium]|nr:MAG: DUF2914 domain-containing protein [Calditrichota bacterium]
MKFLKDFKFLWFFELLFLVFAFYYVYKKPPEKISNTKNSSTQNVKMVADKGQENYSPLEETRLVTAVVCLDVDDETLKPLVAKGTFSRYIDYLYCFAEFSGAVPAEVIFNWNYRDRLIEQKKAKTSRGNRVAWSKMTMSAEKTGEWRVEIFSSNGDHLGNAYFILR